MPCLTCSIMADLPHVVARKDILTRPTLLPTRRRYSTSMPSKSKKPLSETISIKDIHKARGHWPQKRELHLVPVSIYSTSSPSTYSHAHNEELFPIMLCLLANVPHFPLWSLCLSGFPHLIFYLVSSLFLFLFLSPPSMLQKERVYRDECASCILHNA